MRRTRVSGCDDSWNVSCGANFNITQLRELRSGWTFRRTHAEHLQSVGFSKLVVCGGFYCGEHLLQIVAGKVVAVRDDGCYFLRVGDIVERIRFEKYQIGELIFFDGA